MPPPATAICALQPSLCPQGSTTPPPVVVPPPDVVVLPSDTTYTDTYQYPNGLGVYATIGDNNGLGAVAQSGQNVSAGLILTNPDAAPRNYTVQWRMPNGYGFLGVRPGSPQPARCSGAVCVWENIPVPPGESRIEFILQAP